MTDSIDATEAGADEQEYLGEMTVVATGGNPQEAQALQGCLEAAGIPARLADAQTVQTNLLWATALGGVRVMVPRVLVPRASEVIAEYRSGAYALEGDPDPALPPPTTATDLMLWSPDLAALLGLWLTPLFGATLHWHNSRQLGDRGLARSADVGLAAAVLATAAGAWVVSHQDWSAGIAFKASIAAGAFTLLWYFVFAHGQSRFISRAFGRQYRRRPIWLAAALAFAALLAIGLVGEALHPE